MSYHHIENLYRNQSVLLCRELFALEKIHGTSARLDWKCATIVYSSGGVSHEQFKQLFDEVALHAAFTDLGYDTVKVYGEAYGGSCQRMSAIYGKQLKFVVFEVMIGDTWLAVPDAEDVAQKLGLEFVHYVRIQATLEAIGAERDADSVQAIRNGCGPGHRREGVVLRPLVELMRSNGERLIAKHKGDEFRETATPREVDPAKQVVLEAAEKIAFEWVTDMRLVHVLDKLPEATGMEHTSLVIRAMTEDVLREAAGEIVDSKEARKAIGQRAAKLYKEHVARVRA